jgi:hypothetical protein
MSLKVSFIESDENSLDFCFYLSDSDVSLDVLFRNESHITSVKTWENFLSSAKEGNNSEISFCSVNGHSKITCTNSFISFKVMKCGSGGDGEINVRIPYSQCEKSFMILIEKLKEIENQ